MQGLPASGRREYSECVYDASEYHRTSWFTTPWVSEIHGWLIPRPADEFLDPAVEKSIRQAWSELVTAPEGSFRD